MRAFFGIFGFAPNALAGNAHGAEAEPVDFEVIAEFERGYGSGCGHNYWMRRMGEGRGAVSGFGS